MINIFKIKILTIITLVVLGNNTETISNITAKSTISFSHSHGFYTEPFTLEVTSKIENAQIYYTLDGTHPFYSPNSLIGGSTVAINIDPGNFENRDYAPGVTVRVCAVVDGSVAEKVITQTYLFTNRIIDLSIDNIIPGSDWLIPGMGYDINYGLDPEIYNDPKYADKIIDGFLSIPTISLVTDLKSLFHPDSGIYVNSLEHGKNWERMVSLELLNPDGSEGFQINCGMRIRGGWSRNYDNPKHAFRFIFRKEYGAGKLKYSLFGNEGVDEFDNIDLRTSQNYSWAFSGESSNTFLREVFSRDTQKDMEQPYTRSRYYHLYINGTYWGLFQTQERSEASFAESYFGGSKEDYDVIKVDTENGYVVEATDGSLDKWRELWEAGELGFSSDELYFKIQGMNSDGSVNSVYDKLLDVDNLIDYMIVTFFTGDFDGPISNFINNEKPNNFYAIYNRVNPDGFKFFRHDGEHTLFNHPWGIDRTGPFPAGQYFESSNPQWIHQKLTENIHYRLRFADRVQKHLFNNGALTLQENRQRILKRKSEIETAIIAESARWGDSKRVVPFTKEDWNNEINFILNSYLPTRKNIVLVQLINKGLYTIGSAPLFNVNGGIVQKGFDVSISSSSDSILFTTDGSDPYLPSGAESDDFSKQIIKLETLKKVLIPKAFQNSNWLKKLDYNDAGWIETVGGVGYDINGDYNQFIELNTRNYMYQSAINPNTSCFLRIPFNVEVSDLNSVNQMFLDIMYDDGFAAYLNGNKVLEVNVPTNLNWNSTSETYIDSEGYVRFYLSEYLSLLNEGENLLAIHGVNTSVQSSDFLILPTLTIAKQSNKGSISPTAKLYEEPITINETTIIKARSLENDEWGVLSEAKFIIDENLSAVKVTEMHYHPLDEIIDQDTISGKEYEFIELKNIGDQQLDLTASKFIDGISYEFPRGTIIAPGEFIILASNSEEFIRRYGFAPFDKYTGSLDNSGERVAFVNAADKEVFIFTYNDKEPWPEEADGDGFSLVSKRRTPIGNPNNVDYWTLSGEINGSPGENDIVSDLQIEEENLLDNFYLYQNYPNPFNPATKIHYSIPVQKNAANKIEFVSIIIYDILGREVTTLVSGMHKPGNYSVNFDASNLPDRRRSLTSGVYFYKLKSKNYQSVKKMILLR